jgi:site-specific recombinase XerD
MTSRQSFAILASAAEAAGVDPERLGTHSMRKTFAAAAWCHPSINRDMAKMARLLGHSNFSNTLRYIQFLDDSLETAVMTM